MTQSPVSVGRTCCRPRSYWLVVLCFCGGVGVVSTGFASVKSVPPGFFTNPINPSADPWMLFHEGHYYLTTTQGNGLRMWKARTLAALKTASPVTVWTDDDPSRSHGIWAPEFHLINNRWYAMLWQAPVFGHCAG
jgi:hypothetical protein